MHTLVIELWLSELSYIQNVFCDMQYMYYMA